MQILYKSPLSDGRGDWSAVPPGYSYSGNAAQGLHAAELCIPVEIQCAASVVARGLSQGNAFGSRPSGDQDFTMARAALASVCSASLSPVQR